MNKLIFGFTIVFLMLASNVFTQDEQPMQKLDTSTVAPDKHAQQKQAAVLSADAWLVILDQGEYAQSWKEASSLVKQMTGKSDWKKSLQMARVSLGQVIERKIAAVQYFTQMPGAPDGEYVVIQYQTQFQNKESAIETVTPMLDTDGIWRVSGYYVK